MINIPIDSVSSILHPYYDGGESYKGHLKYSLKNRFQCEPEGCLEQSWCGFDISVKAHSETCIVCKDMCVDISDYDSFRLFAMIAESVSFEVYCNNEIVLRGSGRDLTVYDSDIIINAKIANSIKYIFKNTGDKDCIVVLHYLGLLKSSSKRGNPFTDEWEGFFEEKASYSLYNENYITEEELERLREKVKTPLYASVYEKQKEKAEQLMKRAPEKNISKTVRPYHRAPFHIEGAATLALVGQIERNNEMMKMACRYALSLASCEHWCADPMETVPMVTWHHRSFDEADITMEVSMVLSLAGGVLSWHGRNYLRNAIIMKGFPRMEADFMTMEYIYKCNQGIVFLAGYIQGLLAVVDIYPRYGKRIQETKQLLEEMMNSFLKNDGSYDEGATYWRFVMSRCLMCVFLLSRYEKRDISEYGGEILKKTSSYGLAMLGNTGHTFSFGDSGRNATYRLSISALFYSLTGDERWAYYFEKFICDGMLDMMMASTVEIPESLEKTVEAFIYFEDIGFSRVERNNIIFAVMGGPSNNTHVHCDKGSFIIQSGNQTIVEDCSDNYTVAQAADLYMSKYHSLTIPIVDGDYIEQNRGEGFSAPVVYSKYDNDVFMWKCDSSKIWNSKSVKKSSRTIISKEADKYLIIDEFEFYELAELEFRLNINMLCSEKISVEPINWIPEKKVCVPLYVLNGWSVQQMQLRTNKGKLHKIETLLTIRE